MIDYDIFKMPRKPQRQDSVLDQLADLYIVANKMGMYDAADIVQNIINDIHKPKTREVNLPTVPSDPGSHEWSGSPSVCLKPSRRMQEIEGWNDREEDGTQDAANLFKDTLNYF
jgi:hypothetical protein